MTAPSNLDSVFAEVSQALEARDTARAFQALAPHRDRITDDPELAQAWLTLLRVAPDHDGLQADVQRIVERWPQDASLAMAGCDALIRSAELLPPDEPPPGRGAAVYAAHVAEKCLEKLDMQARNTAALGGYLWMNRGNALRLAHRYDDARIAYDKALATDPNNGEWWFNFGLLHKATHAFDDGLAAYQRARELLGERKGVLWNLAICATALGKGEMAAEALRKLGFPAEVNESGMPSVEGLPPVQVRVAALGSGHGMDEARIDRAVFFELAWVSPLSPCHGVVQSTTHRDTSIDYGDVVLWDGTPVGVGEHDGKPVPRFPLLCVLRRGGERRFRFVALEQNEGDVRAFAEALPSDALLFSHRAKTEMLCARCASGDHMRKHEHTAPEPHRLVYGKLVVPADADLGSFRKAFEAHMRSHPKVHVIVPGMLEALGETEAAGKAHQLWRGLERTALKQSAAASTPRD